jgi:hypothetical protein
MAPAAIQVGVGCGMTRSLPPTALPPSHGSESARPLANDPPPSGADLAPWPGLLDEDYYEVVIPHVESLSPEEHRRADQGGPWPIQIRFPSVEAWAAQGGATRRRPAQPPKPTGLAAAVVPALETFLKGVIREAVREELGTARVEPQPVAPLVPLRRVTPDSQVPTAERLTVAQVARVLHVTDATVREYIKCGDLTASVVGPRGKGRKYNIARGDPAWQAPRLAAGI